MGFGCIMSYRSWIEEGRERGTKKEKCVEMVDLRSWARLGVLEVVEVDVWIGCEMYL